MSARAIRHVCVFDIGKTHAKAILFDRQARREVVAITRDNLSRPAPPYAHFDVQALETLLLEGLRKAAENARIDAVTVATHGACAALVADDGLALPPLDYDDPGPALLDEEYGAIRPPFDATGSPRLANGLNLGAQLYWQKQQYPQAFSAARYVLMWPQYWSWRLCGVPSTELTSLASHSDLWDIRRNDYSALVEALEIRHLFPPIRRAHDTLGLLRPDICAATGIGYEVPVLCGIHDSNAALVPFLIDADAPQTIISTGTWIAVFALGSTVQPLPPEDGVMASLDVFGRVVPNFRFPGGRLYARVAGGRSDDDLGAFERLTSAGFTAAIDGDRLTVTDRDGADVGLERFSEAERRAIASAGLALYTLRGIRWIGATGNVVVQGPFSGNAVFLRVLRQHLSAPVSPIRRHGGISEGAATLAVLA